jgi:UDP-glucose 4-epimerase
MRAMVTGALDHRIAYRRSTYQTGYEVLVIDNMSSGRLGKLTALSSGKTQLCVMDVRDNVTLTHKFSSFSPDLVVHLTGQTDVRASSETPDLDAMTNVMGVINVFAAVGVRRVINTSTGGAINGDCHALPTPRRRLPAPSSSSEQARKRLLSSLSTTWHAQTFPLPRSRSYRTGRE